MNREDVQKLLGGYATGTLTPEEQQALFAAALDDQELFDALAREQSLRDLLRDPAAKARVLSALDTARVPWYRHGWWRPAAVAVAMAGIATMAVVVARKQPQAQKPVMVAEVKPPDATSAPPREPAPAPRIEPGVPVLRRVKPLALPKREQAAEALKDLPAPPAPVPLPTVAEQKPLQAAPAEQMELRTNQAPRGATTAEIAEARQQGPPAMPQAAQQGQLGQIGFRDAPAASGGALDSRFVSQNARLLFYENPVAAEAISKQKAVKKAVVAERARAANGMVAGATLTSTPVFHMGVRCSILRKQANGETVEVGIETVLEAGQPVKLKLVPNDRGHLQVWEQGRAVASGTAQPLQPFEAALPDYPSPGARLLYVQFTRDGQAGLPLTPARTNLIQTVADEPEKATYVVNRISDPAALQLVVPITLNYK